MEQQQHIHLNEKRIAERFKYITAISTVFNWTLSQRAKAVHKGDEEIASLEPDTEPGATEPSQ